MMKQYDGTLKCLEDSDKEYFKRVNQGEILKVKISKPRNPLFHRKFMKLVAVAYENQEIFEDINFMRSEMTIASGFYHSRTNHLGVEVLEAKSISFASMDETEFAVLYNNFLTTICNVFKFDIDTFREEIEAFF